MRYFEVDNYQRWARTTAVYPDALTGNVEELMYLSLGLAGEAGEIANKIKKLWRDGPDYNLETGRKLADELGDVAWYLARLADALNEDMSKVFRQNRLKLTSRKERGTLQGSGDKR